eukprot:8962481-Pyramimonas_sp.AAC.1
MSGAFGCCIERYEIAWAQKLCVLCIFRYYILSGSSTSSPAVRKVDGFPPAPSFCQFSALNSGCRGATELVLTGIDSETSVASAYRIQSSELGLLPELGPRNYSYYSSHLQRWCRFSALNSGCKGAAGL